MNLAGKFFSLPFRSKCLLAEALVSYLFVKVVLLVVPFRIVVKWTCRGGEGEMACEVPESVHRVKWAVCAVSRRIRFRNICLVQALTAKIMTARRKVQTEMVLGVRKDPREGLVFHAWLKVRDFTITGGSSSEDRYQVLDRLR